MKVLGVFVRISFYVYHTWSFFRVYNPFESRVKGDKIVLPANKKYVIRNNILKKLDKNIIRTKNSLGFRGEEPLADLLL